MGLRRSSPDLLPENGQIRAQICSRPGAVSRAATQRAGPQPPVAALERDGWLLDDLIRAQQE